MLVQLPVRYDGSDKEIYRTWDHGGGESPSPMPVTHNFRFYSEFFVDDSKTAKVKPCVHTKVFFHPYVVTGTFFEPGGEHFSTHQGYQVGLTPSDVVNNDILPKIPLSILSNEGMKAVKVFTQQVDDSWSVANSIHELGDFSSMFKSVFTQVGKLRDKIGDKGFASLFKSEKKPIKYVSTPDGKGVQIAKPKGKGLIYSVEEVAHKANSANLQYQFAVGPLLSDIQTLSKLGDAVKETYDRLLRENGVDLGLRYRSVDFCETATPSEFRKDYTWPSGGRYNNRFYLTGYGNTYVATQRRIREMDLSNRQDAMMRIALAMAGTNNPMKIIWNGLPMSFVVDFILPIGNLLELGSIPPLVMSRDKSWDLTWSVKETWDFECETWMPSGIVGTNVDSGRLHVERYVRNVGPYVVALPLSTLTISERALASSLLGEKVQVYRNRHKK